MSGSDLEEKNSDGMPTVLTNGAEPIGLLLQLVWSPTETLMKLGKARLFVGEGEVAIVLANTIYDRDKGLAECGLASVGSL